MPCECAHQANEYLKQIKAEDMLRLRTSHDLSLLIILSLALALPCSSATSDFLWCSFCSAHSGNMTLARSYRLQTRSQATRQSSTFCHFFYRAGLTGGQRKGVFAFACQCIISPRGRTGNRTQLSHKCDITSLLKHVVARPNCAGQLLASTLSVLAVATTSYCHAGRHAHVVSPCCSPLG